MGGLSEESDEHESPLNICKVREDAGVIMFEIGPSPLHTLVPRSFACFGAYHSSTGPLRCICKLSR